MKSQVNKSTCRICGSKFTRAGIGRHIKSCLDKHFQAMPKVKARQLYYLHIYASHNADYFLHILIKEKARLRDLDNFLRDIWVECCGHMSIFAYSGMYREISMQKKIHEIFKPGVILEYTYDFGEPTELTVKYVSKYAGRIKGNQKIMIVARNAQPIILCDECKRNPAEIICTQCQWEGEGWLCARCAEEHECGEEMYLPVVNSPRAGVCGYTGN